jgi:DNA-binding transcriptional LysR family regulator
MWRVVTLDALTPFGMKQQSKGRLRRRLPFGDLADGEPDAFYQQRLYSHTYVCMLRPGHPALKRTMTKEVYEGLGHAVVMSPARTNDLLERFLEKKRVARTVLVRTPHHLSLPAIVSATDLIGTVPMATGAYFAALGAVRLVPLPFRPPVFSVQQHWHKRSMRPAKSP